MGSTPEFSRLPSVVPCHLVPLSYCSPVPGPLLHSRPTWAGGYTCCSPARALVAAGGKRGFSRRCPLRWPLVLALRFYIARGRSPPRRPAGMSLPFSSHIWVLGTGAPSPSRLEAWVPARVPCADQRRSGLARAQVTRAGPYMECLPGRSAPPDPAQLPARGDGVGRGSPRAPVGARVRLRSRSCTCPQGLPTLSALLAQGAPEGASHISSLLWVYSDPQSPTCGYREEGAVSQWWDKRGWEKRSQEGKEGDPRSPVNFASPFPPLSSPIRRADPPPPRRGPPAAGGRAAVAGQTAGGGRRGRRGGEEEEEEGSRGQARAAALGAPGTTPGQPELFLSVTHSALGCS